MSGRVDGEVGRGSLVLKVDGGNVVAVESARLKGRRFVLEDVKGRIDMAPEGTKTFEPWCKHWRLRRRVGVVLTAPTTYAACGHHLCSPVPFDPVPFGLSQTEPFVPHLSMVNALSITSMMGERDCACWEDVTQVGGVTRETVVTAIVQDGWTVSPSLSGRSSDAAYRP